MKPDLETILPGNSSIRALLVDDEAMSVDMLEYQIRQHVPAIAQIKKATGSAEAFELIKTYQPHLVFLDIQMPFMSGFELLKSLQHWDFSVIFVTAYNKYAIRAIRFSALDYLLKPVEAEELKQAVARYMELHKEKMIYRELYNNFLENLNTNDTRKFTLALRTVSSVRLVRPDEIIHCTGINNYTQFHLVDQSVITVAKTIKEYEELLADHGFIRTHKSHLVNREYVQEITNDNMIVLTDGNTVEISRRRTHEVRELLTR